MRDIIKLLPTTAARDYKDGSAEHERNGIIQTDTVARAVFNSGEILLPTPNTMEHLPARTGEARERQLHRGNLESSRRATSGNLREDILDKTLFGKFEPAIRSWESVLGRKAPAPTKPDGKDNQHRLSSEFTEWMMGLPQGWITDAGISRNEELKAAGNGVVPQQAELALRLLLGLDIPKALERERELIPTPTVFHVSMHDEPIEKFLARQDKSSTGQIGKSLGVAIRMELGQ